MNIFEVLAFAIVFYSIITFVKILSSHFLRRKIIKTGHIDRAEILDQNPSFEIKSIKLNEQFPALKWGLVAFFVGLGLIVMEFLSISYPQFKDYESTMPYGLFFVSAAMGFLIYYVIMEWKARREK